MRKLSKTEKAKRGTLEKAREQPKTLPVAATERKAPTYLQAAGKNAWDTALQQLKARNILDNTDFALLEEYCAALDMSIQARRLIRAEGLMYEDKNHQVRRHPAFSVWKMSVEQVQKIAQKLTITPYDRARTPEVAQEEPEHDPLDELMDNYFENAHNGEERRARLEANLHRRKPIS